MYYSYNVKPKKISPVDVLVGGSSVNVLRGPVDIGLSVVVDLLSLVTELMSLQYDDIFSLGYPQHDTLKGEVPFTVLTHELEERSHIVYSSRLRLMQKKIG